MADTKLGHKQIRYHGWDYAQNQFEADAQFDIDVSEITQLADDGVTRAHLADFGAQNMLISTDGSIESITIQTAGTGYTNTASVALVPSTNHNGSGSGFAGTAEVTGGAVVAVTITNNGAGYHRGTTFTLSGDAGNGDLDLRAVTSLEVAECKVEDRHLQGSGKLVNLTQIGAQTENLDMGGFRIQNVDTPVDDLDIAQKNWVIDQFGGKSEWKQPVDCATTEALYSAAKESAGDWDWTSPVLKIGGGSLTIDGVRLGQGSRILIKDEANAQAHALQGIWELTNDPDDAKATIVFGDPGVASIPEDFNDIIIKFDLDNNSSDDLAIRFYNGGGVSNGEDTGGNVYACQLSGVTSITGVGSVEDKFRQAIDIMGTLGAIENQDGGSGVWVFEAGKHAHVCAISYDANGNANMAAAITSQPATFAAGTQGTFERASKSNSVDSILGSVVFCEEGDFNQDVLFECSSDSINTLNSNNVNSAILWVARSWWASRDLTRGLEHRSGQTAQIAVEGIVADMLKAQAHIYDITGSEPVFSGNISTSPLVVDDISGWTFNEGMTGATVSGSSQGSAWKAYTKVFLNGILLEHASSAANVYGNGGSDNGDFYLEVGAGGTLAKLTLAENLYQRGDQIELRYIKAS